MKTTKVIFETYKLKYANTGLYHFTKELAESLIENSDSYDCEISILARKKDIDMIGTKARYIPIKFWDKLFPKTSRGITVWHSPYQMSEFMPRDKNTKIVLTVHDLNFLYEKGAKKRLQYRRKLQKNIDRADHIVAISEYSKQDLLKHVDIRNKPVDVIYNGCNVYKGEIAEPASKPKKPFLFGVGTILPKKNWKVLPTLLLGNDYQLYLAGRPSTYSQTIMDEAERLGVADRVKLTGEIAEAEKHWYLSNCEAFLFPSIAEGFGLPVIEAMYYGKPVFISQHTSLPEVGGSFAYYFNYGFKPEQMQVEFAQGMEHFRKFGNPDALKEYALSFSWNQAAISYMKLYKRLSGES